MIRIVSTLVCFVTAVIVTLSACSSGKAAFERGNYYQAVLTSVNQLRRNPGHKKSTETLRAAYPLAVSYYEGQANSALASNVQFKWTQVVNSYTTLNQMGDEIRRSPGALAVITNPANYSAKLNEARQNAAEEQYQAGIMALGVGTRDKAKEAYQYFKKAIEFVANYKDANQKMQDALWAATVKVLVEPMPTQSRNLAVSTDYFNARLSEYLHQNKLNDYVKFYTPTETQQLKLYPDHIVRLEFDEFSVGNVFMSEKEIPLQRDSVVVNKYYTSSLVNTPVSQNNTQNNAVINNQTTNTQNTNVVVNNPTTSNSQTTNTGASTNTNTTTNTNTGNQSSNNTVTTNTGTNTNTNQTAATNTNQTSPSNTSSNTNVNTNTNTGNQSSNNTVTTNTGSNTNQTTTTNTNQTSSVNTGSNTNLNTNTGNATNNTANTNTNQSHNSQNTNTGNVNTNTNQSQNNQNNPPANQGNQNAGNNQSNQNSNSGNGNANSGIVPETIPTNDQVTICHVPQGNPAARHTLTISRSALKAHLEHGDFEGACDDPKNAAKLKELDKKAAEQKKNENKPNDNKGNDKKGNGGGTAMVAYQQPILIASASNDVAWQSLIGAETVTYDTVKVYGTVKATLYYYAKTVTSRGVVNFSVIDTKTNAVLSVVKIPAEYVWRSEWGYYNGDGRALTPQQMAITRNREQMPPTNDEMFRLLTEPVFQQVTQKIRDFYKNY